MKSKYEIRCLRSGKGFFKQDDIVREMSARGHTITRQAYSLKENGTRPFSALEIKLLSDILGLSLDEAYDYFL